MFSSKSDVIVIVRNFEKLWFKRFLSIFCCNQCDKIWRNFATLVKNKILSIFFMVTLVFGIKLNLLRQKICYWANFQCCKWPNMEKKYLVIWSHWLQPLNSSLNNDEILTFKGFITRMPDWIMQNFGKIRKVPKNYLRKILNTTEQFR